jgi:hypothetical protein
MRFRLLSNSRTAAAGRIGLCVVGKEHKTSSTSTPLVVDCLRELDFLFHCEIHSLNVKASGIQPWKNLGEMGGYLVGSFVGDKIII